MVTLDFYGGPADGLSFPAAAEHFEEDEWITVRREFHVYQSQRPWQGERRVKVFHRGPIGKATMRQRARRGS